MERPQALENKQKILTQTQLSTTNATALLSPTRKTKQIVSKIFLCNTTGAALTYSVFCPPSGTTYNATTAITYTKQLAANTTDTMEFYQFSLPIEYDGHLAVQANTANALTVTVVGAEVEGPSRV